MVKRKKKKSNWIISRTKQQNPIKDPSSLDKLPVTYQAIMNYFGTGEVVLFPLRKETMLRIERVTKRPLFCYVTKTRNLSPGIPAYIDDSDLVGFGDLIQSVQGDEVDIFIVSNGGSAEATERIVNLLRGRFKTVRFIVPANAYSAATLMCFSGDDILMDSVATLGPIDPQINGVPARAIQKAFESLETRLKNEGPRALTVYMPLISKYDLHILEICKNAQDLSEILAKEWLSFYMLKCAKDDPRISECVRFFMDYDFHKSHSRSIDRAKTREYLGSKVINVEDIEGIAELVRSLCNQYEFWFDRTTSFKVFENASGINWGRNSATVTIQLPGVVPPGLPPPVPQPGPPQKSD